MPWTITASKKFVDRVKAYDEQVTALVRAASDDKSSQQALAARDDLKAFVDASIALSQKPGDLTRLPVLHENGIVLKGYHSFVKGPYSIVYALDSEKKEATPILIFHSADRADQIEKTFAYYLNGIR